MGMPCMHFMQFFCFVHKSFFVECLNRRKNKNSWCSTPTLSHGLGTARGCTRPRIWWKCERGSDWEAWHSQVWWQSCARWVRDDLSSIMVFSMSRTASLVPFDALETELNAQRRPSVCRVLLGMLGPPSGLKGASCCPQQLAHY
jgi:hypothetical protein